MTAHPQSIIRARGRAPGTEALDSGIPLPPVALERRSVALAIAQAAHRLNTLRKHWLNPPEWVDCVPKIVPGYLCQVPDLPWLSGNNANSGCKV